MKVRNFHFWGFFGSIIIILLLAAISYPWYYPSKMWLHRVDSLEKYNEIGEKYPGIEVDVVLRDSGIPDITHDEDTTFGITLDEYFEELTTTEQHIWIDVKNLTEDNADDWLAWLEENTAEDNIDKDRIILESKNWQTLAKFTNAGWYTSCYIDLDKPSHISKEEIIHYTDSLEQIANSKCVKALSFPFWWYRSIKKYLDSDIDLLTWAHRSHPLELMFSPLGYRMRKDPQLSVILVKEKGTYHQ